MSILSTTLTFTRPADTAAYIALDTIANSTSAPTVQSFAGFQPYAGVSGYIVKAQAATDQKTCTARLRLHLFNVAPTAINDNSPYLTLYANIAARVGTVDFPALATEDPTNSTQAIATAVPGSGNLPLAYLCASDSTLYMLLETLDAFTPANGQSFTIKLGLEPVP